MRSTGNHYGGKNEWHHTENSMSKRNRRESYNDDGDAGIKMIDKGGSTYYMIPKASVDMLFKRKQKANKRKTCAKKK